MTTAACCAPTLVPAIPALPASPPMPRILPGVAAGTWRDPGKRPIRLHRPVWSRAWIAMVEAWTHWRAAANHRAELRALAGLDRHLLRDVGLDDRVPPRISPAWQDVERARW